MLSLLLVGACSCEEEGNLGGRRDAAADAADASDATNEDTSGDVGAGSDTGESDADPADGAEPDVVEDSSASDVSTTDSGESDADTDTAPDTMPEPPPPCDPGFEISPVSPNEGAITVRYTHGEGFVYIGLSADGPGSPSTSHDDTMSEDGSHTWTFTVTGHRAGLLNVGFTADMGERTIASCTIRVAEGGGGGDPPGPGCTPDCSDKLCGEDDGCGTACSGSHRNAHGAVSDCRAAGNCGCGVEPNDNMTCQGDGRCAVRCSCDCLPGPVIKTAEEVRGLDFGGACTLVFRESGDPTVWDAANNRALCPVDFDPQDAASHAEHCPPCHRKREWVGDESWCECRDPRWIDEYRAYCCPRGICF